MYGKILMGLILCTHLNDFFTFFLSINVLNNGWISTRIPDVTKPSELPPKEIIRKPELPKKTTRIPSSTTFVPIIESSKETPELPVSIQTPTSPSLPIPERSTEASASPPAAAPFSHIQQPSTESKENVKTPELSVTSIQTTQETTLEIKSTTEPIETSVKSVISPSRVQQPTESIESTNFKSFYARPGIVLDDTDYTPGAPGALEPSTSSTFHNIHRNTGVPSSATLSNIYAEVFDVTLSAIQGQPHHNKVVDLIEIENTEAGATDVIQTRLYGTDGNDIIVSASDDNSFVSIDGKRTYINLFGETAETEHLKKPMKTHDDHRVYSSKTVS